MLIGAQLPDETLADVGGGGFGAGKKGADDGCAGGMASNDDKNVSEA